MLARRSGQDITIEVVGELISKPYIEITLNLMARFGVSVRRDGWRAFTIARDAVYRGPGRMAIEGDASTASYFLALGAIGGGPVRVTGVGEDSIQGDVAFAATLAAMGADVRYGPGWIETRGVRVAEGGRLKAFDADFNLIPDAAMTAATLALYADGPCRLRNIGSWRVKETDRIHAMHTELEKLGRRAKRGGLAGGGAARARRLARRPYRHLGRPPHGHVLLAGRVRSGGGAHPGSGLRQQDFPDYFDVYAGLLAARD